MSKQGFHRPARRKCDNIQQSKVLLSIPNNNKVRKKVWEIKTTKAGRKITL